MNVIINSANSVKTLILMYLDCIKFINVFMEHLHLYEAESSSPVTRMSFSCIAGGFFTIESLGKPSI